MLRKGLMLCLLSLQGYRLSSSWTGACGWQQRRRSCRPWAPLLTPLPAGGGVVKKDAPCIVLPHQSDYISHIALDIGALGATAVTATAAAAAIES